MIVYHSIKGLDIGGNSGGAERFGVELVVEINRHNVQTLVCVYNKYGTVTETEWVERLNAVGIPVFFAGKSTESNVKKIFRLLKFCKDQRPTIYHSHYQFGSLTALLLKVLAKDIQIVRTIHISKEWGEGLLPFLSRVVFSKYLYPIFFNAQVAVSEAIKNQVMSYPGVKISNIQTKRIYNAISLEWVEKCVIGHQKRTTNSTEFTIGSVGRLTQRKGYRDLISAMPEILAHYPNTKLLLIGEGEEKKLLEEMARDEGIDNAVIFLGKQKDVWKWLDRMDLFILPSYAEGLPTVILECMAVGVPVLATDISGTRELIKDQFNGELFEPHNPKALSDTLISLLKDEKKRVLYSENAKKNIHLYSFPTIAQQYLNLYENLNRIRSLRI